MNNEDFKNIVWCDLEVVMLKIYSKTEWNTDMLKLCRPSIVNKPIINIFLCDKDDSVFNCPTLYRERKMLEGCYIGHHFGESAKFKILDERNIALYHKDPGKIIWCYIYKYLITIYAHRQNKLNIKAGAILYKEKAFVILGRGGSGKTEMIRALCNYGSQIISNTHLLVQQDKVFGVQTNVRVRHDQKDVYIPFSSLPYTEKKEWYPIGALFWVNYCNDGKNIIRCMTSNEILHNLEYFAEPMKNWEMKEDIADYYHSEPYEFSCHVCKTNKLLRNFCENNVAYYLNVDVRSKLGIEMLLDLLEKHI